MHSTGFYVPWPVSDFKFCRSATTSSENGRRPKTRATLSPTSQPAQGLTGRVWPAFSEPGLARLATTALATARGRIIPFTCFTPYRLGRRRYAGSNGRGQPRPRLPIHWHYRALEDGALRRR